MSVSQDAEGHGETDRDKPLMVSSLSTFSMVMGLSSCVLLLLVIPAVATAILAIVTGHISAAYVRANKVELLGLGRARIGLLLGYFCLAAAVFLFPQMERGRLLVRGMLASDHSVAARDISQFSDGILGKYEREVYNNPEPTDGDGPVAVTLAKNFRRELKAVLQDVLELENGKGLSWDASRLKCHCYYNSGVVFFVREPGLAGFNDSALDMLTRSAWQLALETVQNSEGIEATFPVAVCIMGKRQCQTFVMGQTPNVDISNQDPTYSGPDSANVLTLLQ